MAKGFSYITRMASALGVIVALGSSASRGEQNGQPTATNPPLVQQDQQVLKVVGDREYPPYCFLDNGIPSGFDIDMIRAIAAVMGFKIQIELRPWADARHELLSGRADIIPGMARIPSREAEYDFTTPTKYLRFDLFVPEQSPIETMEDARKSLIVVQKAGVMYDLIKHEGLLTNLVAVTDAPQAMRLLAESECDGAIVNRVQGHYIIEQEELRHLKALNFTFPTIPYCFAVRKGEVELQNILNEGLSIIKADGTYETIYEKWFGLYDRERENTLIRNALIVLAAILLITALLAIINWSLRRQVQMRTAELRLVIDLIPHLIFARDREGRYTLVNRAMADSMNMEVREIIGRSHADFYPQDAHTAAYLREDQQVFESGQPLFIPETEHIDRKGRRRYLQVSKIPFQVHSTVPSSVLCVAVDITDLKLAEEAASNSRENLVITLNSIADGVLATDADGRITRINPVAAHLMGIDEKDVLNQPLSQYLALTRPHGESLDAGELVQLALNDKIDSDLAQQAMLGSRGGEQRLVSMKWSPIKSESARITGLVLVMRDITDEMRMNQRLAETQKMESIGRLAGGVAHDFNNLLAGIMGYAELLNISLNTHDECRTYLKGIFEASERARDLVQQLLTFSRRQPREIKPVNMHTVIGHVIALLQHTLDRRITVSRHFNATMFTVMGDRSQLQNSLLNLGVNARDAMPTGGSLTITTRNVLIREEDCLRFPHPLHPGPFIEVFVSDTGVGMDQETILHIFEPFFTTKGNMGGTGLGLAAVYGAVKEHGGYVDVTSKPGHGSVFRLGLPVLELSDLADDPEPDQAQVRGSGCVLIVDDEPMVMKTIEAILRGLGYKTLTAVNGREALSVYLHHRDEIDLVILDMIMPEMNGRETFRELKRIDPDVRVMICSGYLQEHGIEELMDMGILGVLQKPFRKSELSKRVAYAIQYRPED